MSSKGEENSKRRKRIMKKTYRNMALAAACVLTATGLWGCAEACKHLSDRRQHDQKSAVCGKSAAEHCFSAAREHTAALSRHRQPEHAAEQFTAACKHLSDRRQRDKKSAVCCKSAESAFFGKEGGRAAAQSTAERIYCEQEQRRRQPDADAVSQELYGLAHDQRSEQEGTAARAERRLAAQARL